MHIKVARVDMLTFSLYKLVSTHLPNNFQKPLDNCRKPCIMGSMMKNKPTTQELVNLVEFLSHRIDMLDKTQDLMIKSHMMLSNREKEVIAFCDKNRNYQVYY